jgi:hypothetical protein
MGMAKTATTALPAKLSWPGSSWACRLQALDLPDVRIPPFGPAAGLPG